MGCLEKLIEKADVFGVSIQLRVNDQESVKTFLGGALTLILIGFVAALTWVSSENVIYKLNPRIALENQIQTLRPNLTLDIHSFPISIIVQDAYMNNVNKPEYFSMLAVVNTLINTPEGTKHFTEKLEYILCTPDYFPEMDNSTFYSSGLNFYYCLKNQNLSIGGFYDSAYTQYLELTVKACRNSSVSEIICKPEDEIQEFFETRTFYWSMYYQNSVFNTQNYNNPRKSYLVNMYKTLKYGTYKLFELFLKEQELLSDDGIIMTEVNSRKINTYDFSQYDFSDMDSSGTLCSIYIFSSSNRDIFHRNYTKVQEVLANVGGLAKALLILFELICLIFSTVKKNEIILNKYFDFDFETDHCKNVEKINSIKEEFSSIKNLQALPISIIPYKKEEVVSSGISKNNVKKIAPVESESHMAFNNCSNNFNLNNKMELKQSTSNNEGNNKLIPQFKIDFNKIINRTRPIKSQLEYGTCEVVKMYLCRCLIRGNLRLKYNLYTKGETVLNKLLDITYYIEKTVKKY